MTNITEVRHICNQTAEGLEREINRLINALRDEYDIISVDTSFDGSMFNAYLKLSEK